MDGYGKVNTINTTWRMAEQVWVAVTLTVTVPVMPYADRIAMGTLRNIVVWIDWKQN